MWVLPIPMPQEHPELGGTLACTVLGHGLWQPAMECPASPTVVLAAAFPKRAASCRALGRNQILSWSEGSHQLLGSPRRAVLWGGFSPPNIQENVGCLL